VDGAEHNGTYIRPFNFVYTGLFNVLEMPATQCPIGLSTEARGALPVGVQVVAAQGRDHLSIAVALQIERAFGGWRPPIPLAK